MTVRKRIDNPKGREISLRALIEKGADVKEDRIADKRKWTYINLRIAVAMIDEIDNAVADRIESTMTDCSRTAWILEALREKLERDQNE